MKNGRVECYIHSDEVTENKGACIVRVVCRSEAAARTEEFKAFAKRAAYLAYAASHTDMDLFELFPDFAEERSRLMSELREEIFVEDIQVIMLQGGQSIESRLSGEKGGVSINTADPGPEGFAVMHSKEEIKEIFEQL